MRIAGIGPSDRAVRFAKEPTIRNSATDTSYQPTQPSAAPRQKAARLREMEVFLGSWKADGRTGVDSPTPGRMRTEDTYAWFDGGFFLIDRGMLQVNDEPAAPHIWIIGYDEPNDCFFVHAFDSLGDFRLYRLTVQGRTWTYMGDWERATVTFDEDGNGYRAIWEHTKDGSTWHNLCDVKAERWRNETVVPLAANDQQARR